MPDLVLFRLMLVVDGNGNVFTTKLYIPLYVHVVQRSLKKYLLMDVYVYFDEKL